MLEGIRYWLIFRGYRQSWVRCWFPAILVYMAHRSRHTGSVPDFTGGEYRIRLVCRIVCGTLLNSSSQVWCVSHKRCSSCRQYPKTLMRHITALPLEWQKAWKRVAAHRQQFQRCYGNVSCTQAARMQSGGDCNAHWTACFTALRLIG